jgi:signal transduction histidine kinase
MRSDVDFPPQAVTGFRSTKIRIWRWASGGVAAVLILALLEAPVWAFALVLCMWCTGGALWLQSDVRHALQDVAETPARLLPPGAPNWHNWLSGWYWETDAQGVLRVLTPGAGLQDGIEVDWDALSAYLRSSPAWLACWQSTDSNQLDLKRFQYCLTQHVAWAGQLALPWPDQLPGLYASEPGWTCVLMAETHEDEHGVFAGFKGVMVPRPPAKPGQATATLVTGPSAEELAVSAQAEQMREAEQEALRYAISHDLRAPLRVVEGFTRIVKEDYSAVLDRLGQDHLDRVMAAANRMNGMIDAILAQAQLAGTAVERLPVDLSAMAREIGGDMQAVMPGSATAEFIVADGLLIDADPLLVRRVLENLIGNAFKYSAKVAAPRVEFGVMPATNPAVFFVRDNGAGFDMQHADKLFGMFQRLHSAKEFPGTGVGLAGVQNIVRRHGGRVWAEARPGEGACFYFTLMDTLEAQQRTAR